LEELAKEAQGKLADIDQRLAQRTASVSAGAFFSVADWPPGWQEAVSEAFQQYDKIVDDYGAIPTSRRELRTHVQQQRRRPEYAAALNEPEARTLLELAQEHESQDHACCAYWVYQQGARLVPAPSAQEARSQLTAMQKDPAIRAAAEVCRELQWCHRTYNIADKLSELAPDRAQELFAQVVQRSPADAPVHLAAQARLQSLAP
jgi:hypothetical protein